jgi:hypothetical protein
VNGLAIDPAIFEPAVLAAFDPGPVYVGCLVFGGGLVMLLALGGGHHESGLDAPGDAAGLDAPDLPGDAAGIDAVDVAPDVGATDGIDTALESDAATVHAPDAGHAHTGIDAFAWFSLRFVVYFLAVFGMVGTVLTYMSDLRRGPILAVAAITGLAAGQIVHWFMRAIIRSGSNSEVMTRDLVNRPARVTVAIARGRRGQVAVPVRDSEVYLSAVALREDDQFALGDRVVVKEYQCGIASVISHKEHTFRQDTGERAEV